MKKKLAKAPGEVGDWNNIAKILVVTVFGQIT